jgi:hypothetical protein
MTKRPILVSCMMIWLAVLAGAQQSGTIRGTVLDEKGKPVSGATVFASRTDGDDATEKSVPTDPNGGFVITDLVWGKYTVSAEKPGAGYPRTPSAFYGNPGAPPVLEISAGRASAKTKIEFRGKVPAITGTVFDDEASVPIPATFLLRHAQEPANVLSVEQGPNYYILVPPGVGLTLAVSARGYKTWYYPGTNDYAKRTTLNVSPGQALKLNIRLDGQFEDCACLDPSRRRGVARDSPALQWQNSQDALRHRACSHTRRGAKS